MDKKSKYEREDYVHSANSLFHFMTNSKYLDDALKRKALCPRYCNENVEYLNIQNGGEKYGEVSILQKCFCDIPLSSIIKPFPVKLTENNELTDKQKKSIPETYSHTDLYGKYAIAFAKEWGEKNRIQPIQYLNQDAACARNYSEAIKASLVETDIPDVVADSLLGMLCYCKPLRGTMKRRHKTSSDSFEIEIFKNFHDEHEWRHVPFGAIINQTELSCVIANRNILVQKDTILDNMSNRLEDIKYQQTWLKYQYEDIRYIIVPDNEGRIETIRTILSLDEGLFDKGETDIQKSLLISKITVLDDIVKDN